MSFPPLRYEVMKRNRPRGYQVTVAQPVVNVQPVGDVARS
jgi:hypothetical protein